MAYAFMHLVCTMVSLWGLCLIESRFAVLIYCLAQKYIHLWFTYSETIRISFESKASLGWHVGGGGGFPKLVATFNYVGGSFNLLMATTGYVWIIPSCHRELWPTSASHPFSSLISSLGLAGGKHYQKITIPNFRLVACYTRLLRL